MDLQNFYNVCKQTLQKLQTKITAFHYNWCKEPGPATPSGGEYQKRSRSMQRTFRGIVLSAVAACLVAPAATATTAQAAEKPQEWELVNPAGIIEKASIEPAKRIASLEGKTIALRWNGKHNGDVVLDHLAGLLAKKYPTAKIIKPYETDKSLIGISGSASESERVAKAVASVKPDLVIASQCD